MFLPTNRSVIGDPCTVSMICHWWWLCWDRIAFWSIEAVAVVTGRAAECVCEVDLQWKDILYSCNVIFSCKRQTKTGTDQLEVALRTRHLCKRHLEGRHQVVFPPFLIGQKLPQMNVSTPDAWKYANHDNIAIEPQLTLCYEDFKDHHLPDIHNKGIKREGKV